jgi:hypothetical protein
MSDAKEQLKAMQQGDGHLEAAAALVSRTAPGDPPSEAEVNLDYDFMGMDPTDATPYLKDRGMDPDPGMIYRWCNSDPRVFDRRRYAGWEPVVPPKGGQIRRGDLIMCQMPRDKVMAQRARIRRVTKERENAPMRRFEQDVSPQIRTGLFSTFDGSRGPRDGMD